MADLMVELQQIGGSRLMAIATTATPLGFSCGFSVGFGFDFGLGWFSDRFWLILSWVSWWVSIDFELGFLVGWLDFGLAWFWVGFSNCLCWFWFNFLLILGKLCGALSTVQVACVDVGSVVVGFGGGSGSVVLDLWLVVIPYFFLLLMFCRDVVNDGEEVVWQWREINDKELLYTAIVTVHICTVTVANV